MIPNAFHEDVLTLLEEHTEAWVCFSEKVWLSYEEHEEWAFGVYDYVDDIHVFYVNQYGPSVLIATAGPIDDSDWHFFTDDKTVIAFVEVLRACSAVMKEAVKRDADLDTA